MKEYKDDKMIDNLILPIYTRIGRNIIAAAMRSQTHGDGIHSFECRFSGADFLSYYYITDILNILRKNFPRKTLLKF